MSNPNSQIGAIVWHDLTVPDAESLRRFYCEVVGWQSRPHAMGDYDDFELLQPDGACIAGVCHARGVNAGVPPQWLMYVQVADLDESICRCNAGAGTVLDGPRLMGAQRVCVIRDPAGAVLALAG